MDWLQHLTDWIAQQIHHVWDSVVALLHDLIIWVMQGVCDLFASLVEAIGVPDFMTQYSLGALLGQLPSGVQWMLVEFRIPEGLALLAAGVAFNLVRKLLTLGQW